MEYYPLMALVCVGPQQWIASMSSSFPISRRKVSCLAKTVAGPSSPTDWSSTCVAAIPVHRAVGRSQYELLCQQSPLVTTSQQHQRRGVLQRIPPVHRLTLPARLRLHLPQSAQHKVQIHRTLLHNAHHPFRAACRVDQQTSLRRHQMTLGTRKMGTGMMSMLLLQWLILMLMLMMQVFLRAMWPLHHCTAVPQQGTVHHPLPV